MAGKRPYHLITESVEQPDITESNFENRVWEISERFLYPVKISRKSRISREGCPLEILRIYRRRPFLPAKKEGLVVMCTNGNGSSIMKISVKSPEFRRCANHIADAYTGQAIVWDR